MREDIPLIDIPLIMGIILAMIVGLGMGVNIGNDIWGSNPSIAPTYTLDTWQDRLINLEGHYIFQTCEWQTERTAYSFCGKVIVNSSAEFDILLKDIEKHSYHIQMGWMHLDYEYAHNAYDNTFPAPVNICMGTAPGDNFPIGSEWEGRMAYVIDECASLGSCDFDTLTLSTPTPTCTCEDK